MSLRTWVSSVRTGLRFSGRSHLAVRCARTSHHQQTPLVRLTHGEPEAGKETSTHEKPVNRTLLMFNCSERLSFWNCCATGQDAPGTWEGLSPQVSGWTDG